MDWGLLPEDHRTVFRRRDIGPIYRRVSESDPDGQFWLQRLLSGALLQYQSTGSIGQVSTMLNMSLELCQNEIELRYNMLRYYVWLIPTLDSSVPSWGSLSRCGRLALRLPLPIRQPTWCR